MSEMTTGFDPQTQLNPLVRDGIPLPPSPEGEQQQTPPNEDIEIQTTVFNLKFHAQPMEYFKIWIVNLALTLVTFGIYSAWAKVRNRKYLYGNLELARARFDYHAKPIPILMGRVVTGTLFAAYSLAVKASPFLAFGLAPIVALIFPWLLVRASIFNYSNTSYRNVRFGFKKDYKGSYKAFFKAVLVTIFTLGFGWPYALYLLIRFRLNSLRYGSRPFQFMGKGGAFYVIYLSTGAVVIAINVLVSLFLPTLVNSFGNQAIYLSVIATYVALIAFAAIVQARTQVHIAKSTNLGDIQFVSHVTWDGMTWIYFSNIVASILSLGMLIPWAVVRALKYRLENTQVIVPDDSLKKISAQVSAESGGVFADAASDFWDVDLGL